MALRLGRITDIVGTKTEKGIVPVSAATWWRWVEAGLAPKPFKLGPGVTLWDLDKVDAFVTERAASDWTPDPIKRANGKKGGQKHKSRATRLPSP